MFMPLQLRRELTAWLCSFWMRIDWPSFGTAGFISLVAGAVRTGMTLRSSVPTYRVLQEGAVDAFISLAVGAVAF